MKGQWFPQSLFCPLVCFVDVFLAFKRIPHHSMYDMEKHVLSSCHTSSNSTLVSRPNWRDWWREVVFQRSRSIEKNNIVFVLFTNCTILKKAKKSPFLALTLFDHVPKRKSGICYSFNGGQLRLMYQRLVPIWYTNVVPINSHNAILQITTKL